MKKININQNNDLIKLKVTEDTSLWINKLIDDNKLDEIHSIPDTLYYSIIEYINYNMLSSKLKMKSPLETGNLIKLVYRLIGSTEYINNPNLKCRLFNSIMCQRENIEFISKNKYFCCDFYKDDLIKNFLILYNSLEHVHSKVITRYNVIWFLTNIVNERPLFLENINKIPKTNLFDKFLFIVISEINDIYDTILKYYNLLENNNNNSIESTTRYTEIVKSYVEFLTLYLQFTSKLSKLGSVRINFMKDIIIDKFTDSIIYFINNFVKTFIKENVNFSHRCFENIKKLTVYILELFDSFHNSEVFKNSFVREDTIYNEKLTNEFKCFLKGYNPQIQEKIFKNYNLNLQTFIYFIADRN